MSAGLVFLLAAFGPDPGEPDLDPIRLVAIQHDRRVKPLDTFAREMIWALSGSRSFAGFKDPRTRERVEVFPSSDPMVALLEILSRPDVYRDRPMIRIDHRALKRKLQLDEGRVYFSYQDLRLVDQDLLKLVREVPEAPGARKPEDPATLQTWSRYRFLDGLFSRSALQVIPVPVGERDAWPSLLDLKNYLQGDSVHLLHDALNGVPRQELQAALDRFDALLDAYRAADAARFGQVSSAWAETLRRIGGPNVPDLARLELEVGYNRFDAFRWALLVYALALATFCVRFVFRRTGTWWGVGVGVTAVALHLYGLVVRWMISDRQPFSNMYESLIALALAAPVLALILEGIYRRNAFGIAASVVGAVVVLVAEYVPDFNPSISPLVPALQSFWMTIHVPCMMFAYGGALVLGILGHLYIFTRLFSRRREEDLEHLDLSMYRALQVTALFMLAGVSLGAVWAGEAWGRYWGWDMKEVWAFISLVFYVALLHGRLAGFVKGPILAAGAAVGTALIVWTYYGVNFVFGSGLHSYGFGAGRWWVLLGICAVEVAVAVVGLATIRRPERAAADPEGPAGP